MKLGFKIILVICIILTIVIGGIAYISYYELEKTMKDQAGNHVMDVAWSVSAMEAIQTLVTDPKGAMKIQQITEELRKKTRVHFIVVMNRQGIRYSHPVPDEIGKHFVGGDELRVLNTGEAYISEGTGTLGMSLRAFAPIYQEGQLVGAVAVGILIGRVYQEIAALAWEVMPYLLIALVFGALCAVLLATNIKRTIFGLEPKEIAWILSEKDAVLQSVKEGIVAINQDGNITLFNQTARRILGFGDDCIGQRIDKLIPETGTLNVLITGEPVYNREFRVRPGVTVLCNYHPIRGKDEQIMGVVASFQEMTEIKQIAEELTGIKKMAWALRAQNHEFMNKLHTIAGLIQLGETERALQFISQTAETRQEVMGILTHQIKEPSLAGLLLARYNKAAEARVELVIDECSCVQSLPEDVTVDELALILGNLIDNALDAVVEQGNGRVHVKIYEESDSLFIEVEDNSPVVPISAQEQSDEQDLSTKEGQRSLGLSIVRGTVESVGGEITLTINGGTHWRVKLPMRGGKQQ